MPNLSEQSERIPTREEFRSALAAIDLSPRHRRMLMAHAAAPDRKLTATELAEAAGYDRHTTVNLQYGLLGKRVAKSVGVLPPFALNGTRRNGTMVMAEPIPEPGPRGHWGWRMREALVGALKDLGLTR